MATTTQLRAAMRSRSLVRFNRRFEKSSINGYVMNVGPRFFLLLLVSDRIRFDGFEVFRIADVRRLRPDPQPAFVELVLKRRSAGRPSKPKVNLADVSKIIESIARCAPLLTIHHEMRDPNVCRIGRPVDVSGGHVSLLEIGTGGAWDREPTTYTLKGITRINFGGDYEDALYVAGGEPT